MANERSRGGWSGVSRIHFSWPGLAIFILGISVVAGFLTLALARPTGRLPVARESASETTTLTTSNASWGQLIVYDTQLERPEEYTSQEVTRLEKPRWTFPSSTPEAVSKIMLNCGFTEAQIRQVLQPGSMIVSTSETILFPTDELVLSMSAERRARFYRELARTPANHYMHYPFCFPGNAFETIVDSQQLAPGSASLIRKLLYPGDNALFLSDLEVLMNRLPDDETRRNVVQALSARSAVLARVQIRPETDIDQLLSYWASGPGSRQTTLRPLLESVQRLPDGATISLLYFLPQFARERLYTYPEPSSTVPMDCHWSTMNFFNETPDDRFSDPNYTVGILRSNYHTVPKPTQYGDLVFILDRNGNAIHSAVYIADDIVFTKNGNNYMEPWMLMRLKNLLAMYSVLGSPNIAVFRSNPS